MYSFRGQKGFTLFTALVAFMLISLSLLLINSMVSTERSSYEIVADISEQQEMQAIADLSRADALQVFNYGIRYAVEDFSKKDEGPGDGKPDNTYFIFPSTAGSWQDMEETFVRDRFGIGKQENSFAIIAARHLISLLLRSEDARGFKIDLVNPDEATMATLLQENFEQSNENSDFFEVIQCENGEFNECVGTFYVTLDLSKESIDDVSYEKFPQVKVQNNLTGRVLKEPILPRGKFRVYVPVRLFKALAGAREIAFANGSGMFDQPFIESVSGMEKEQAESFIESSAQALGGGKGLMQGDDGFKLEEVDATVVSNIETGELSYYDVTLIFLEENEKYRVSSLKDNRYGVTLRVQNLN